MRRKPAADAVSIRSRQNREGFLPEKAAVHPGLRGQRSGPGQGTAPPSLSGDRHPPMPGAFCGRALCAGGSMPRFCKQIDILYTKPDDKSTYPHMIVYFDRRLRKNRPNETGCVRLSRIRGFLPRFRIHRHLKTGRVSAAPSAAAAGSYENRVRHLRSKDTGPCFGRLWGVFCFRRSASSLPGAPGTACGGPERVFRERGCQGVTPRCPFWPASPGRGRPPAGRR